MSDSRQDKEMAFREALSHDDDLVAVVRGHLYIEFQVNQLIEGLLPQPKEIRKSKLGWPQRVELSLALGLKKQYGPPLKKLGAIRNKFAHRPDARLEEQDVKELYQCLHENDRDVVIQSYEKTRDQASNTSQKDFRSLDYKDQFTLMVVAIHTMLRVAVSEATDEPVTT